jgi:pSer/pThr/pTyr-binding forkhead associated (FHA) protein
MARLIVAAGGSEQTIELVAGKALVVGRDPTNDIPLPDERQASRRHCEIRSSGARGSAGGAAVGGWEVADLGATNKTRVNGSPIEKRALSSGDVIEVGKVTLRFEDPEEEARLSQAGKQGVCLLEYAEGPRKGERVLLSGPRTTLGRRAGNTIVLEDRMASGHHAEVVKDLNGYTIRDLGSTNGIMVNGQPTTEAPLAHGTRLRVGGTRFVFRDPSMKEIEVELARLDEDDGWGMMGEIDLSRARVSKAGTLSMLAFLGVVGAGGWLLMREGEKTGGGGPTKATGEQIVNGSFDTLDLPWSWPEGGSLAVVRSTGASGGALEARNEAAEGARTESVTYDDEILASSGRTVRVRAELRGDGELLAVWRNDADRATGATAATLTHVLGSGRTGAVDRSFSFPSWAASLSLVLRVPVGARLTLDDLSVRTTAELPATAMCDCPGLPSATVEADGTASIQTNRTPLAVAVTGWAWKGGERLRFEAAAPPQKDDLSVRVNGSFTGGAAPLPGSLTWTAVAEGLELVLDCPGAERVGLSADLPRAHVGGSLNVLTSSDARGVPLAVGAVEGEILKTLVGNPKPEGQRPATLLAFQSSGAPAALAVEDSGDPAMVRLVNSVPGAKGTLLVVTEFAEQAAAAKKALEAAKVLAKTAPGAAIGALRQVAQANPFEAAVAEEANTLARQLEEQATEEVGALRAAVQSFRILGSPAALAEMQQRTVKLRASFPAGGGTGVDGDFDSQVAKLAGEAESLERAYALDRFGPQAARLERLASTLGETQGYEAMAVLIYRDLGARLGALLGSAGENDPRVVRLVQGAAALEQRPGVEGALPPR